jgi:hypothetical protein
MRPQNGRGIQISIQALSFTIKGNAKCKERKNWHCIKGHNVLKSISMADGISKHLRENEKSNGSKS